MSVTDGESASVEAASARSVGANAQVIRYTLQELLDLKGFPAPLTLVAMDCPPDIDVNGKGFITERGHELNSRGSLSAAFEATQDGKLPEVSEPAPAWKARTRDRPGSGAQPPGPRDRGERGTKFDKPTRPERPEWRTDRREPREREPRRDQTTLGRPLRDGGREARQPQDSRAGGKDRWGAAEKDSGRKSKKDLWDAVGPQDYIQHSFAGDEKVLQPFFMDSEDSAPPGLSPGAPPPGLSPERPSDKPAETAAPAASGRSRFATMFAGPSAPEPSAPQPTAVADLFAAPPSDTKPAHTNAPSEEEVMARLMQGAQPKVGKPAAAAPKAAPAKAISEEEMMARLMKGSQSSSVVSQPRVPTKAISEDEMMARLMAGKQPQEPHARKPSPANQPQQKMKQNSDVMAMLQPALFQPNQTVPQTQQPACKPAVQQQPQKQAIQVPAQYMQHRPMMQQQPGMVAPPPPLMVGNVKPVGPPPPLLAGQTFNPGQFFNMFEGVNMGTPQPAGRAQGLPPTPSPLGIPGPPAPINMGFPPMPGFQPHHGMPQQQGQRQHQKQQQHQHQQRGQPQQQHPHQQQQHRGQQQRQPMPHPMPQPMQMPPGFAAPQPLPLNSGQGFSADAFFSMAGTMGPRAPPQAK